MDTQFSKEQQSLQSKSSDSRIRYVEELAGEEDAWVSITDAARITRTSEAMARRWVTSGRLPVKRQAVGINQHTRLVRLSDVAAIRPIIDPTAAISDEVHTIDLPSIHRQQAQLMRDHESLLQQIVAGQKVLEELEVQLREQKNTIEQSQQDSREHEQELYREMNILSTTLGEQLETIQKATQSMIQEKVNELAQQSHDWQAHIESLQHELIIACDQHDEQLQKAFEEMTNIVRRQHDEHRQELLEQQKTFAEQQESVIQFVKTRIEAIKESLEQHDRKQEHVRTAQTERLEMIEQWVRQVVTRGNDTYALVLEYQKRVHVWERQLQTLIKALQSETQERKKLSEHFLVQQKQIQHLRHELDSLKR